MLGLAPRLPITITLLTAMTTNLLVRLRPLPVHRAGRAALSFHSRANFFRAALTPRTGGPCADFWMRERSGRQDVPERKRPKGLARLASAANATTESGGEAEIAGGVGVRRGAATRSLRSARGAAHSAAPCEKGEK